MSDICGAQCRDDTKCQRKPMDNGRCWQHGGKVGDNGAPEGNVNGQTHALYTDRDGYYQNLGDDAQAWLDDFTHALLDRVRNQQGRDPDLVDKELLKNIAIDCHKVAHANDYFKSEGLTQHQTKTAGEQVVTEEQINIWASEIRNHNDSIYRRLKKHGLLNDPESQKADALGDLTVNSDVVTVHESDTNS